MVGKSPAGNELVSMEDAPIAAFIENVDQIRTDYMNLGSGPGLLIDQASKLKKSQLDFLVAEFPDRATNKDRPFFWDKVLRSAIHSDESSSPFLAAYIYSRLNIIMSVEFKPDETPTTQIIRSIGLRAIALSLRDQDYDAQMNTLNYGMYGILEQQLYGDSRPGSLHPDIKSYVDQLKDRGGPNNDPALARVLWTANSRQDPFILGLDKHLLSNIVHYKPEVFPTKSEARLETGEDTTWQKVRMKTSLKSREEEVSLESPARFGYTDNPPIYNGINLLELATIIDDKVFDTSLAKCLVRESDYVDRDKYQSQLDQIVSVLYPEEGKDVNDAEAYCDDCPVRMACLGYAIDQNMHYGVWGGKSSRQRQAIGDALSRLRNIASKTAV